MIIGICDDNKADRQTIRKICEKTVVGELPICQIIEFENGTELIEKELKIDLLILDIEMPEIDGIQVKDYLQKMDSEIFIIYVTSHEELAIEAFGLNVFAFVVKRELETKLPEVLISAIQILHRYTIVDKGIDSRKIIYIQSERVYSKVFLVDGTYKLLRISLTELEEQLQSVGFVRVHKSYIVNMKYIKKINSNRVILNNIQIPISIRLKTTLKSRYIRYCEKNAGYC